MSKIFDLWNTVAGAFGPSGREDAVRETIAEIAGAYIDDVTTDALGNLICRKKGAKNGKKLLFAAHMDSIGVVATYIEDKGFIRFSQIGGLYVGDLLNIQVKFANGTRGVISYEEKTPLKDLTLDNLFIDIGAKNAEEARKLVQIGDFAVYEAPRFEQNGVLCGPYLDNRIGCVTLLLMMEQLADKEIENDLYFVFTAQEEVGLRGAGAAAFAVEPDAAIAVDVTDTGDLPEMKSAMAVELGKEPAVKVMRPARLSAHRRLWMRSSRRRKTAVYPRSAKSCCAAARILRRCRRRARACRQARSPSRLAISILRASCVRFPTSRTQQSCWHSTHSENNR